MRMWICLVLLFALCSTSYAQNPVREAWNEMSSLPEEDAYEYGSIYEAFFANNVAWEQGDVLVKVVTILDSTGIDYPNKGDLIVETTEYWRFRFDYTKHRYLCVRVKDQQIPLLAHPKIPEELKIERMRRWVQGFAKNDKGLHVRVLPRKVAKPKESIAIEQLMRSFKVPNLRTIGLISFGNSAGFGELQNAIARLSSGEGIVSADLVEQDLVKLVRRTPIPGNDKQVFVSTVEFDLNKFVPLSNKIEVEEVEDGQTELSPQSQEKFEWESLEGVMVPSSVVKESIDVTSIAKQRFIVEKSVEVSMIWKGLNSEIPDSDFSESVLEDLDAMIKLTSEEVMKKEVEKRSIHIMK